MAGGLPLPGVRVLAVPAVVPAPDVDTDTDTDADAGTDAGTGTDADADADADDGTRIIVAAGRLVPGERFDLLLAAFSAVCTKDPDWRLRIHGEGPERTRLRNLIDGLGLTGRAELAGPRMPDGAEFAGASIAASASDAEASGPALVEAMRRGVPVVGTGRPPGPTELIQGGGADCWCRATTGGRWPGRCWTWSGTRSAAGRWAPPRGECPPARPGADRRALPGARRGAAGHPPFPVRAPGAGPGLVPGADAAPAGPAGLKRPAAGGPTTATPPAPPAPCASRVTQLACSIGNFGAPIWRLRSCTC
ncbi:glycosyltransferase [Streptomyces noursei]|nr:glycosyltransferase [Streptomyces noursei]